MSLSDVLVEADRCTREDCSARAYVRVLVGDSTLDFCSHHYGALSATLTEQGYPVLDERWKLDPDQVKQHAVRSRPRTMFR